MLSLSEIDPPEKGRPLDDMKPKDLTPALRKQIDLLGSANRALEKQADNLHRRVEHLREELKTMAKDREGLRALVRKLAEGLEFYGEKGSYRPDEKGEPPVIRDKGVLARRALSHLREEE